ADLAGSWSARTPGTPRPPAGRGPGRAAAGTPRPAAGTTGPPRTAATRALRAGTARTSGSARGPAPPGPRAASSARLSLDDGGVAVIEGEAGRLPLPAGRSAARPAGVRRHRTSGREGRCGAGPAPAPPAASAAAAAGPGRHAARPG